MRTATATRDLPFLNFDSMDATLPAPRGAAAPSEKWRSAEEAWARVAASRDIETLDADRCLASRNDVGTGYIAFRASKQSRTIIRRACARPDNEGPAVRA